MSNSKSLELNIVISRKNLMHQFLSRKMSANISERKISKLTVCHSTNPNEATGNDRQKLLLSQYYRGVYDGCAECALSDDLST